MVRFVLNSPRKRPNDIRTFFAVAVVLLLVSWVPTTVRAAKQRKILCLHGGDGNAAGFRGAVADLEDALPEFEFVYVNGGYSVGNENYVWVNDPPGGKDEPTTDPAFADDSVDVLDAIVEERGPFYGILGYSQGAAFVPVYLSRVPHGTFEIAITFCGYLTTTHLGLLDVVNDESPFGDVPALVWMGSADLIVLNAMTREMATKFTNPRVVVSDGAGHVVPRSTDSTFDQVTSFISNGGSTPTDPTASPTTVSGTLCRYKSSSFLLLRSVFGALFV